MAKSRSPVLLAELIAAGLLQPDEELIHSSPGGRRLSVRLTPDGRIRMPSGAICTSPSEAARAVLTSSTANGWAFWRVERLGRKSLAQIRDDYRALV